MGIAGVLAALIVAGPINVINAGGGNALTLPAARHVVRLDSRNGKPATWLLAAQQDGADGHWLGFWRSDNEAQSWSFYAPIQDNCCERDTPDMIVVGMDIALVYSYEGPSISGSVDHNVYFQWWRWNGNSDWVAQAPLKVFDSGSNSTGYLRGEIARDSRSRIWIWAQRLNSDGTFTMVMTVSSDAGASFQAQPSMDTFADRPGGRIIPISGNQMMLLYGTHGVDPGYMRTRSESDPVGSWSDPQVVFPEGLYHGAALSAPGDGSGGVHLVYKDGTEQLWYRHWSGGWSDRQLVEGNPDWALQPAITRVGGDLVIFWNRPLATNRNYQFYYRILESGSLGPEQILDHGGGFDGYPAAAEVLPTFVPAVPCFLGKTPDANSSGSIAEVFAPTPNATPPPPPPDGGILDAGPPDAGPPDAGPPDAGAPDAGPPDAGPPDAGAPDAGTPDAGSPLGPNLTVQTTWQSVDFDLLAVDASGTAFGVNLSGDASRIYASSDGRSWAARGAANGSIWIVTALADGTLLADLDEGGTHVVARSTDHGNSWTDTLVTGVYRTLSPHSFAELDGAAYFIEYQVFTTSSTPIRL